MMFGGATRRMRGHAPRSWFLRLTIVGCLAGGLVASPASGAPGWSRPMSAELFGRDSLYQARFGSIDSFRLDS